MSSERFYPLNNLTSTRFNHAFSMNEHVMKIKEDLDMKRLYESKCGKMNNSNSFAFSSSSFPSTSNSEGNQNTISRLLSQGEKRSMSEITNLSRFREFSVRNRSGESESSERMRAIWLPIARRTVQWFAGRERSLEGSESERQPSYV
ncbi:E3 ubiquitin-protein ligase ATL42 [Camellia lanceoleosa]|nr:E3 ubiquitin-protein ligase ATL42 [Camellia lanceoleosa]